VQFREVKAVNENCQGRAKKRVPEFHLDEPRTGKPENFRIEIGWKTVGERRGKKFKHKR